MYWCVKKTPCCFLIPKSKSLLQYTHAYYPLERNQMNLIARNKSMAWRHHLFPPSCVVVSSYSPFANTIKSPVTIPFNTKRRYSITSFRNASLARNTAVTTDFTNQNNNNDTNWQEWFGIEYENPWQGFGHLQDAALDQTTRFLIQQLQDLYHGILGPYDRPSTGQCKKVCTICIRTFVSYWL